MPSQQSSSLQKGKLSCDRSCLGIRPKYVSYSEQSRIPLHVLITVGKCSKRQAELGKPGHVPSPLLPGSSRKFKFIVVLVNILLVKVTPYLQPPSF